MLMSPEERRRATAISYRLQKLRETGALGAMEVESPEFWRLGAYLAEQEAAAASQREVGNMLNGDGVSGARGCGNMTGCQAGPMNVETLLRMVREIVAQEPEGEYVLGTMEGMRARVLSEN